MICPQCGYDIGNKNKCLRCGYEVKTLVVSDRKNNDEGRPETKVIDPDSVYISNGGYDDSYADPFDMLFGNIFDPIGDLLGGLFGLDVRSHRSASFGYDDEEEDYNRGKKGGEGKVVEVKKVEILDDDGNPVEQEKPESKIKQTVNKIKNKIKNNRDDKK